MQKIQKAFSAKKALELLLVFVGNLISAVGVGGFVLPASLMMGGATGFGLAASHYFGLPVSAFVAVYNLLMFTLGAFALGRHFALTTLLSTFLYPTMLSTVERLVTRPFTEDLYLNILIGGALTGIGIGMVIRAGSSTGGNDIPVLLLKKWFGVPLSVSMYALDILILLLQLPYSDLETALYSILLVVVYSVMADKVSTIGKSRMEMRIISKEYDRIKQVILTEIDRGVTLYPIEGGHSGQPGYTVMTVVSPREVNRLNRLVMDIDPEAFVILSRVSEVQGRGFTLRKQAD